LSWDGFWRFTRDLDLGLSDIEIAKLRQQADTDMDGYIDWNEMVEVLLPLLVREDTDDVFFFSQ
jgi:Ca2+-binding EF-hand superfamily protein